MPKVNIAEHLIKDHGVAETWMNGKSFLELKSIHDVGKPHEKRPHTHDPKNYNDPVYGERSSSGKV